MRGLIILCIATVVLAAPQGHMDLMSEQEQQPMDVGASTSQDNNMYALSPEQTVADNEEPLIDDIPRLESDNTIQELPEIQQNQQFSVEFPLAQDLSPPTEEPRYFDAQVLQTPGQRVLVPFTTYGPPQLNEVVVTKQFFIHSAPEEEEEEIEEKIVNIGQSRRNYNVVFIRAPVASRKTSALRIIPAVNEDKTIVYVLSKKSEADNIHTHVDNVPTIITKPEVHFIKYKTQDEAKHAQEKIQADYELLGGSTDVSNEGVSPVSSVVGSLDTAKTVLEESTMVTAENASPEDQIQHNTISGYLPPIKYYRY